MGTCEDCRYLREYKIHKRIINYHPCEKADKSGITHYNKNSGTVYVSWDIAEFEGIFICERIKCEPYDDVGCELWEGKE